MENEVGDEETEDNAEEMETEERADDREVAAEDKVTAAVDDALSGESGVAEGAGERTTVALDNTPEDTALRVADDVATTELFAPPADDNGRLVAVSESDSDDTDRPTLVPAGVSQLSCPLRVDSHVRLPDTTIRAVPDRRRTKTDKAQTNEGERRRAIEWATSGSRTSCM